MREERQDLIDLSNDHDLSVESRAAQWALQRICNLEHAARNLRAVQKEHMADQRLIDHLERELDSVIENE